MGYVLLTGATGMLGQYLLRDFLLADKPVAVLARGTRTISARHRVDSILSRFEQSLGRNLLRPVVLEGNLYDHDLGLTAASQEWLAEHCDTVVHSAASLTFVEDPASREPFRTNVDGTRNLLNICRTTGVQRFHHVSTAYVCGKRADVIREDELDVGQEFANDYERSKCESERLVRGADWLESLTVYRPSIIVGDSVTGFTSTFSGFYTPLQLAHAMSRAIWSGAVKAEWFLEQLGLRGHEEKNLVPVDWVSATMLRVVEDTSLQGRTYHLTNPKPVSARTWLSAMTETILTNNRVGNAARSEEAGGIDRQASAEERSIQDQADQVADKIGEGRSSIESLVNENEFRQKMQIYEPYLRQDPSFDSKNTLRIPAVVPCPRLEHALLVRLANFAVQANFGWPRPAMSPPRFDLAALFQSLVESHDHSMAAAELSVLQFEVSGSGGGSWRIAFERQEIVHAEVGLSAKKLASGFSGAFTTVDILAAIICGEATLEDAIRSGRLIIEAESSSMEATRSHLSVLCRYLAEQIRSNVDSKKDARMTHSVGKFDRPKLSSWRKATP